MKRVAALARLGVGAVRGARLGGGRLEPAGAMARVSGRWHGWSVYIPVDGFFFADREAIYRTEAEFRQHRSRVRMTERLSQIYDIDGMYLDHVAPRQFSGWGKVSSRTDMTIAFHQRGAPASGTMVCTLEPGGAEMTAILAVRPRLGAPPVAVKLLLRRVDRPMPRLDEIGIERIRRLAAD